MEIIYEKIETKIVKECDVLVCGGGFAGISAALAAAREGKQVVLLEKQYMLGGLGTSGLVTVYLPLCDGMGHQVSFGIAEELFKLSISMGAEARYPYNWLDCDDISKRTERDPRYEVRFNPQLFAILSEQLLLQSGVEILYGSYAVAVEKHEQQIHAVMIENKSGRQAIKAKTVVDATGDCDIAYFSGAPTELFEQGNDLAAWYYYWNESVYDLRMLGYVDIPDEKKSEGHITQTLVRERFSGVEGEELSKMMQLSHASILNDVKKCRVSCPNLIPTTIATIPQVRMTRRLVGEYQLHTNESHKYFEDSVGMVSNWKRRGPVYEVPFRTLYSKQIKNLIVAGRCTSVTDSMWDIMRVIPCCAVTGQAAGCAAAMTDDFSRLDARKLQDNLMKAGVKLHQ